MAKSDSRDEIVQEHVEAAVDQIASASLGDLRSTLMYWFGVMFDAGRQQAEALPEMVSRLREMNHRLEQKLLDSELPPPPEQD